jgi:hypothetical protein
MRAMDSPSGCGPRGGPITRPGLIATRLHLRQSPRSAGLYAQQMYVRGR